MFNRKLYRFFAIFGLIYVLLFILTPVDSTDKSWFNRSGMHLYTDHGTGVQYLKAGMFGGMTPRLDKDGKIITVERKK